MCAAHADANKATVDSINIDEIELQRQNQEMIASDLITPDRLYADLALFRDYNIGVLASFHYERKSQHSPEEHIAIYQSMIDGLPAYHERKFNDMAHYFPRFIANNEQFQERLRDPKWAAYILHHAPITPYVVVLHAQIAVNVNHSAVLGKRDPIELTINTYPLLLPERDQHIVRIYFSELLKVNVKIIHRDPATFTLKEYIAYDEVYTYYLKEILDCSDIREGYSALKFVRKRLYAAEVFGPIIDKIIDMEKAKLIIRTHLDVLTQFLFVPPRFFSTPPPDTLPIKT